MSQDTRDIEAKMVEALYKVPDKEARGAILAYTDMLNREIRDIQTQLAALHRDVIRVEHDRDLYHDLLNEFMAKSTAEGVREAIYLAMVRVRNECEVRRSDQS